MRLTLRPGEADSGPDEGSRNREHKRHHSQTSQKQQQAVVHSAELRSEAVSLFPEVLTELSDFPAHLVLVAVLLLLSPVAGVDVIGEAPLRTVIPRIRHQEPISTQPSSCTRDSPIARMNSHAKMMRLTHRICCKGEAFTRHQGHRD